MKSITTISLGFFCIVCLAGVKPGSGCRVSSERLKAYTRKSIEKIVNSKALESVYWPDEPLNTSTLSKAANLNITIAETKFNLQNNEIVTKQNETQQQSPNYLIQDFFVTCSIDRDKSYTLTINLELDNPFKMVEFEYRQPNDPTSKGIFKIFMNQSTYLVQLNQRISYDECLDIKYVQLDPNLNYEINCTTCDEEQKVKLDKLLSKRMTQLDSELNSLLSEKLLLGLQVLLNQQRLDLDLFLS